MHWSGGVGKGGKELIVDRRVVGHGVHAVLDLLNQHCQVKLKVPGAGCKSYYVVCFFIPVSVNSRLTGYILGTLFWERRIL